MNMWSSSGPSNSITTVEIHSIFLVHLLDEYVVQSWVVQLDKAAGDLWDRGPRGDIQGWSSCHAGRWPECSEWLCSAGHQPGLSWCAPSKCMRQHTWPPSYFWNIIIILIIIIIISQGLAGAQQASA